MRLRVLHLADLHLGQRFHEHDRSADETHALDFVAQLAGSEAVDVVCLAGDIFDIANPGVAEIQRYHAFLERLVFDEGVGSIVVIAGNHDNHARIAGPQGIYQRCHIYTRGAFRQHDDVADVIIPLRNRSGEIVAEAVALPFLREGDIRSREPGETHRTAARKFVQAMQARLQAIHAACSDDLPRIVVAHAYAVGASEGGGERPIQVGNLGQVPAAALAGPAAYMALGHLHVPQAVAEQEHWRYSGSLLPTGFDEIGLSREVVVADIIGSKPAQIHRHAVPSYRQYRLLRGSEAQVLKAVRTLPKPEDNAPAPWFRAQVHLEKVAPGMAQHLSDAAAQRGWQCLGVEVAQQHAIHLDLTGEPTTSIDIHNFESVFQHYCDQQGQAQDDDLLHAFRSLQERCDDVLEQGEQ